MAGTLWGIDADEPDLAVWRKRSVHRADARQLVEELAVPPLRALVRPAVEDRSQGRAIAAGDVRVDCHRLRRVDLCEVPADARMGAQVPE